MSSAHPAGAYEFELGPTGSNPPFLATVLYAGTHSRVLGTLIRVVLLLGILAVIAERTGTLVLSDGSLPCVSCDFLQLAGLTRAEHSTAEIPLTRDYATIYHVLMISLVSVMGGRLLLQLRTVIPRLIASLAIAGVPHAVLSSRIARTNKRLGSWLIHVALFALAFGTSTVGVLGYQAGGIYSGLGGRLDGTGFAAEAAAHWWAAGGGWGFWGFVIVGGIGNYVNYWVLYATTEVSLVLISTYRQMDLRVDLANGDGQWGWKAAKDATSLGSLLFVASAIGLAAVVLIGGITSAQYLLIFPIALALSTLPFLFANRIYQRPLDERKSSVPPRGQRGLEIQAMVFSILPTRLVKLRSIAFQASFTVLPGLLALVAEIRHAF